MKKIFMLSLIISIMSFCSVKQAFSADDSELITRAIEKYKSRNYIGCISDLKMYTETNTKNATAWYYLGNSYMNIAMKDDAYAAFNKVIELDSNSRLTSYAIQAQLCMEDVSRCDYQNFKKDEVEKLKQSPIEFLNQYFTKEEPIQKSPDIQAIENLIDNSGNTKLHQEAAKFIDAEHLKMQTTQANN